mmetsp:Transcript_38172/g.114130  ORF Transcript_38172/g.114130 Transcript_38172/m.114130 type:complete len:490 (-) Transcript_38172:172-1641(-)
MIHSRPLYQIRANECSKIFPAGSVISFLLWNMLHYNTTSPHSFLSSVVFPQHAHHRLECEPLRNVLPSPEHLAELGPRKLLLVKTPLLGLVGRDVSLLLGVHEVERGDGGDPELGPDLLGEILGVVRAVKVLPGHGRLGSGHVPPDDEVGAPEVLADHHVLNRLAGSGHVHRVREVLPERAGVVRLLLEDLVRLVPDVSGNVVGLGGAARRVDEDDSALADEGIVEGAGEELVVCPVDGVAALEGDDVGVLGEAGADLLGGLAGEIADGGVESRHLAAHVVAPALGGDHEGAGVLDGGGAVALEALHGLVGGVFVGELDGGDGAIAVLEEDGHSRLEVLVVRVEDDGDGEDGPVGEGHVLDDALVGLLVHETLDGGEAAVHDELDVAQLTGGQLELGRALGDGRLLRLVGVDHEVDELPAVGLLLHHVEGAGGLRGGRGDADVRDGGGTGDAEGGRGGEGRSRGDEGEGGDGELHRSKKIFFRRRKKRG